MGSKATSSVVSHAVRSSEPRVRTGVLESVASSSQRVLNSLGEWEASGRKSLSFSFQTRLLIMNGICQTSCDSRAGHR